jgi:hypothetical protein
VRSEKRFIRALPKFLWFFVVLLIPIIGAVLWLTLGKDRASQVRVSRSVAPDDDLKFLREIERDRDQDERIRLLEEQLAELDDEATPEDGSNGDADADHGTDRPA